jgi:hypothetical protein
MPIFTDCVHLADVVLACLSEYEKANASAPLGRLERLAEVVTRVRKLREALEMLDELIPQNFSEDFGARKSRIFDRIEIVTEAFYYSAWRVREVVRSLPGLKSFEATGVRDVRNQLLEHPEKYDGIIVPSFGISPEFGPRIKPARRQAHARTERDRDLLHHATEFFSNLVRVLAPPQSTAVNTNDR